MPTYEYQCEKCGHQFEKFQSMTETPIKKCPECRGRTRRLIGAGAGILFKGSGFYQTDYRTPQYQKRAQEDKPSGTTEKKPESKDQKSAPKSSQENSASKKSTSKK